MNSRISSNFIQESWQILLISGIFINLEEFIILKSSHEKSTPAYCS